MENEMVSYEDTPIKSVEEVEQEEKVEVAQEFEGEMGTYKVINPIEFTDENGENTGTLEVGSLQDVPAILGEKWVVNGDAERVDVQEEVSEVSDTSGVHENTCTSCEG